LALVDCAQVRGQHMQGRGPCCCRCRGSRRLLLLLHLGAQVGWQVCVCSCSCCCCWWCCRHCQGGGLLCCECVAAAGCCCCCWLCCLQLLACPVEGGLASCLKVPLAWGGASLRMAKTKRRNRWLR
jgi:hypothetical protein